jgi:CheY-like chemotaxis protein
MRVVAAKRSLPRGSIAEAGTQRSSPALNMSLTGYRLHPKFPPIAAGTRQQGTTMNALGTGQPFMALVDDDSHSARLMIRMLLAHGAPSVSWLNGEALATAELGERPAHGQATAPGLVIVDLKHSSTATLDFIAKLRGMSGCHSLPIAAIAPTLDREPREALLSAGADAVFERHSDINSYRREAAAIVSFWVRNQHLDAVGA